MKSQIHKLKDTLARFRYLFSNGDPLAAAVTAMLFAVFAIIICAYCDTTSRQRIDELEIQVRELRETNYAIMEYLLLGER